MPREIEYQAYWAKDKLITLVDTIEFLQGGIRVSDGCCHVGWLGKDCELMEFTGSKDKNGKKIFEGHIVNCVYDGNLNVYVVVFDSSELDFKATNGKENYGKNFQYLLCCEEVEVIGNIYENPKLLK